MLKGLAAGIVNLVLAFALAPFLGAGPMTGSLITGSISGEILVAGLLGLLSYGVSLVLFVLALRDIGAARTGAYFASAPFIGAILAVAVLGEPVTAQLLLAGALMLAGLWLHLTERHSHEHEHMLLTHDHRHHHDIHHRHDHALGIRRASPTAMSMRIRACATAIGISPMPITPMGTGPYVPVTMSAMPTTPSADRPPGHAHDHAHAEEGEAGHGHHSHAHGPANYDRAFAIGTVLNLGFVIIEAGFGLLANSMALLADAGHNLSDVLSLLLAWGAAWLTRRRPTSRHTYGFGSSSILASLTNAMLLLVAVGAIAVGAVGRLFNPEPVAEGTVIWVAAAGILVNGITAWMFMRGRKGDLNIRGAYMHMAADAGVSAGVVVAAIAIWQTGWYWLDPLASLAICVVIVLGSFDLLKELVRLAMAAVPGGVDRAGVERPFSLDFPGYARCTTSISGPSAPRTRR